MEEPRRTLIGVLRASSWNTGVGAQGSQNSSFCLLTFIFRTLCSFFGTAVVELCMRGRMRRKENAKEGRKERRKKRKERK